MSSAESPEQILALGRQALELLQRHGALPSPDNYELWFAYAGQRNEALVQALDRAVTEGKASDRDHARLLHARFFAHGSSETYEEVGNQLNAEVRKLAHALGQAGTDTASFGATLKTAGNDLDAAKPDIKTILHKMTAATRAIEARNKNLETQLQSSMKEVDSLRTRMETVRKESLSDALTGLANRRCFDDRMREAVAEARSQGKPLCVAIGDVDHFKRFNDTYGHAVGDQVLRLVAQCFTTNVKGRDTAARFGGEEFIVILPQTTLADAATLAGAIRTSVETKKIVKRSSGETLGGVTLSFGVAKFVPGEEIADLINRADACLYAAKRAGRNRVLTEMDIAGSTRDTRADGSRDGPAVVAETPAPAARSTASLSFEYAVRALCRSGEIPLRAEIDLRHFHRFARWIVIAEPELAQRKIPMQLVGSGFFEFFGRDLTGSDYLDLADPSIRDSAYESAIEMIRRPCGLWQETPAAVAGSDQSVMLEYTAFPILDERRNRRQILAFVNHKFSDATGFPSANQIQRATNWVWIDLGQGAPAISREGSAAA